jgi:uncharacterized protein YbbK (DUF523 family)
MKVLISACLLGENVRYDGGNNLIYHDRLKELDLIACCPEVDGGLPTPRIPSEVYHDSVFNQEGKEVTSYFKKGANIALDLVRKHDIKVAIMKAKSPSCGNEMIYDGTFSKTLVKGKGFTVALLEKEGVKVFNEHQLEEAFACIFAK